MKFLIKPLYDLYRKTLRNSKYRWIVVVASLLYLISPINFATDAVPVLGWIDDGVIATLLITEISQYVLEQRKVRKANAAKAEVA
jgi:uncharacterized membrane protein YkvA (DUF1232 family)